VTARWLLLPLLFLATPALAAPLRLGAVLLTDKPDKDVLVLPPCKDEGNQPVTRLQLVVTEHPAQIDHLDVVFRDGQKQVLQVRDHFAVGGKSRWIDMIGPARCIARIHVGGDADTLGRTPGKQARVAFWGDAVATRASAPPPAATPPEEGTLLGRVRLSDQLDRDVVALPKCPSPGNHPVSSVRVTVHEFPADLDRIKVVFGNGDSQMVEVKRHFIDGASSAWKDLPGKARCIAKIVIVGDTNSIGFRPGEQALVSFYGK